MTHEEETRNFLPCTDDEIENDDDLETRGLVAREFDDDYEGDGGGCYICGGAGFIVTCIDDMCRGAGECMHGDGESPCPNGCEYNL